MFNKDYLLKQLHQLLDELKQRMNTIIKSEISDIDVAFDELYKDFFQNSRDFFLNLTVEKISELTLSEDQLTVLVELMIQDSKSNPTYKNVLLKKSLEILNYLEMTSKVYSEVRINKIRILKSKF